MPSKSARARKTSAAYTALDDLVAEANRREKQLHKQVDALLASMREARAQQLRAGYRIGEALAKLLREDLLGPAGLTFEAAAREAGYGRSQAFKLVTIAEHLTEDQVTELGYERGYLRARALAARRKR